MKHATLNGILLKMTAAITTMVLVTILSACTKNTNSAPAPMVAKLETSLVGPASPESGALLAEHKSLAAIKAGLIETDTNEFITPSDSAPVVSKVTLNKDVIFKKALLYGSDLQYSSIGEVSYSLIRQSEAGAQTLAYFRIADQQLQLLADQRHLFESDINHPERLIQQFPILAQDEQTITIEIKHASPVLNTAVAGIKTAPVRTSWVRSVQYVSEGQYLMFETSIELADGTIAEFMETIFPRESVVPADTKPIYNDPDMEPMAERYRFLDMGEIFVDIEGKGRVKTKVASRFRATPGAAIDWYVTPNIPEEYMVAVKTSLEGWNRYSQKMWGKDVVSFKGRLPQGVKLGDPRFNIVNWDSVAEAGAAYESQATDPLTGLTSHSLIYLPKAWVNIGKKYWDQGVLSTDKARAKAARLRESIQNSFFLGQKLPVHCLESLADAEGHISLAARLDPDTFSKELLKGVLFHEVGHALGLAHNFKASLSFDPTDPKSVFSTSIMDYNQYQIERAAFESVESANGPLLEYDRQIMSVLYNGGKDVANTDPKLPACEDSEADSMDDGVDPLCIRYDSGKDPSQQLLLTLSLIKDETAKDHEQRSLASALKAISGELGDSSTFKAKDTTTKQISKIAKAIKGTANYYHVGSHVGLSDIAKENIRLLRKFKSDSLPEGYLEREMRLRAIEGIRYAATTENLEPLIKETLGKVNSLVQAWLVTTNYITSLAPEKQTEEVKALMNELTTMPETLETAMLSKMRRKVLTNLSASEKAPFFFKEAGPQSLDFEQEAAQILSRVATTAKLANGNDRLVEERMAAAKALKTFLVTAVGARFLSDAVNSLESEARSARDSDERSNAMAVLKVLKALPVAVNK
jgi:hypothetical protein